MDQATTSLLYRLTLRGALPLVPLLIREAGQRTAHRARLASAFALVEWGRQRDRSRPLAWFHAASVGEGLQAQSVIEVFRRRHPDALIVYTHFSPSAETLAARIGADWSGYLPYDRWNDVGRVLDAVRPDLLVFSKVDVWPELASRAAGRGIRVALVAGTVETGSSRLRWPARALLRPGYRALHAVGAIDQADAERLISLGVAVDRVTVTGDPRVDSAIERAALPALSFWVDDNGPLPLIAGSTWLHDEIVILQAFARVRAAIPDARLVLVPHAPTPERIDEIRDLIRGEKLPAATMLSDLRAEEPLPPLVIVDRVGILAGLYRRGAFAYVGGGYGKRGIHSVLEPAAAVRAVVVGPNDRGSRDARLLHAAGALERLAQHGGVERLTVRWRGYLSAPAAAEAAGALAKEALMRETGASERSTDLLDTLWKVRG